MHRFYLPPEQCQQGDLSLRGGEAHHALDVLRVRPGDRVVVLDGAGGEFLCQVRQTTREQVALEVLRHTAHAPLPCRLTLAQALPKGKTFEAIVQKATELGASRLVPLLSERVVSRLDQEAFAPKVEKWRRIAREALKQCGAAWLPEIGAPLTPQAFLGRADPFDLSLLAALQGERRHPRAVLQAFQSEQGRMPATLCVWIGPEGDFTPAELEAIRAAGTVPISLGPRVLRSETAALYCLSVLNYELQASAQ